MSLEPTALDFFMFVCFVWFVCLCDLLFDVWIVLWNYGFKTSLERKESINYKNFGSAKARDPVFERKSEITKMPLGVANYHFAPELFSPSPCHVVAPGSLFSFTGGSRSSTFHLPVPRLTQIFSLLLRETSILPSVFHFRSFAISPSASQTRFRSVPFSSAVFEARRLCSSRNRPWFRSVAFRPSDSARLCFGVREAPPARVLQARFRSESTSFLLRDQFWLGMFFWFLRPWWFQ